MLYAYSSTLVQWENTHFDAPVGAAASVITASKSERGIVQLAQTTCKAMCRHGSKQSGVYQGQMRLEKTHLLHSKVKDLISFFMMLELFIISLL